MLLSGPRRERGFSLHQFLVTLLGFLMQMDLLFSTKFIWGHSLLDTTFKLYLDQTVTVTIILLAQSQVRRRLTRSIKISGPSFPICISKCLLYHSAIYLKTTNHCVKMAISRHWSVPISKLLDAPHPHHHRPSASFQLVLLVPQTCSYRLIIK